jgi:hypothetical protein
VCVYSIGRWLNVSRANVPRDVKDRTDRRLRKGRRKNK